VDRNGLNYNGSCGERSSIITSLFESELMGCDEHRGVGRLHILYDGTQHNSLTATSDDNLTIYLFSSSSNPEKGSIHLIKVRPSKNVSLFPTSLRTIYPVANADAISPKRNLQCRKKPSLTSSARISSTIPSSAASFATLLQQTTF
jgi:hypothetical protein